MPPQEEYFITHHCFIGPGAVYVVCCKTQELFDCGASILLPWLAMIKVCNTVYYSIHQYV